MPRKPIIQTMVATSLAISGSAEAKAPDAEPIGIGALDIIGTDFPDDTVFFVADDIDLLTYRSDEDLLFAQEKKRETRTLERRQTRPAAGDRVKTTTKTVPKVPEKRSRTDTKPEVTRTTPEVVRTTPDATRPVGDSTVACCTVYGGTGNDAVVGGGIGADTVYAGDPDDVLQVTPRDTVGGAGGTRLRSGSGSSIKLRGQ